MGKLIADGLMIQRALKFLQETGTFHQWCQYESNQLYKWIGEPVWLHSDRWSATYDWLKSDLFNGVKVPDDMVGCLVEYWETNSLHIKIEN